jgi:hypothetical protein
MAPSLWAMGVRIKLVGQNGVKERAQAQWRTDPLGHISMWELTDVASRRVQVLGDVLSESHRVAVLMGRICG